MASAPLQQPLAFAMSWLVGGEAAFGAVDFGESFRGSFLQRQADPWSQRKTSNLQSGKIALPAPGKLVPRMLAT